jgi:poly(3-hydroxybutyrate) depolymerase
MAAALLAAYPEAFAAGAVVAGLPVGAAGSTSEALRRMAEAGPVRTPAGWADQIRGAAPIGYAGPWLRLIIWHGEADRVLDP